MTDEVQYQTKTVKTVRGTEGLVIAKQKKDGWELVDQTTAKLQATLNFRRPKPPTPWKLIAAISAGVLALVTIIGIGAATESDDKTAAPKASPTTTATKKPESKPAQNKITATTVDELLDSMNNTSDVKTGDRFRITGELFESDAWGTGASGDYSVMLKAKGGKDDLPVFVKESDADTWTDGTKVEMVLEAVKATINGETTDGWLRAEKVKTLSGGTTAEDKAAASTQKLFSDLNDYATRANQAVGSTLIDSIERGYAPNNVNVNLNSALASNSLTEIKTAIQTINNEVVEIAQSDGVDNPIVKYFIAGAQVAENRYILSPTDVKFQGMLDD